MTAMMHEHHPPANATLRKRVVLWLLSLLTAAFAYAGSGEVENYLPKSSLVTNASMDVWDLTSTEENGQILAVRRTNTVSLVYNRDQRTDIAGDNWTYTVNYQVVFYGGVLPPQNGSVTISSGASAAGPVYRDIQVYNADAPRAKLKVLSTSSSGTPPADIHLELGVRRIRHWDIDPNGATTLSYDGSTGLLSWPYVKGAESYDVEWNWIDQESTWPAGQEFHAAVRVNTPNQWYTPDLSYRKGTVFFRVRAVGRFVQGVGNDFTYSRYTIWSNTASHTINNTNEFEADKNYNYVTKYTEGGKFKKLLTYMDGGLKGRQQVTNLSSEEAALATQTEYDEEGRGVIQSLPVPIAGADMHFRQLLNTQNGNPALPYPRSAFDNVNGAQPMEASTGAAGYYASGGGLAGTVHRNYLPNAGGYPFAQQQFKRDHTGRLERQGGVGADHQLGSGREARYFYADAEAPMLYRLFGTKVGDPSHYRKEMMLDANEQVAVTYKDMQGRTIATALAGDSPQNLIPLAYMTEVYTVDMMPSNDTDRTAMTSDATHQIANEALGKTYNFTYDLRGVIQQISCICKSCRYEVDIRIINPDGDLEPFNVTAYTLDGPAPTLPVDSILDTVSADVPYDCSTTMIANKGRVDFNATFNEFGTYTVVKRMRVIAQDLDALAEELKGCPDFPDSTLIADTTIAGIDTTICGLPCEDWVTITTFLDEEGRTITYTQTQLDSIADSCCTNGVSLVNPDSLAAFECGVMYLQMLAQVSPGGPFFNQANWDDYINNVITEDQLVQTHREYCHYTICGLLGDSKVYDIEMGVVATMSQAMGASLSFPTGYRNDANDPIFQVAGFPAIVGDLTSYADAQLASPTIQNIINTNCTTTPCRDSLEWFFWRAAYLDKKLEYIVQFTLGYGGGCPYYDDQHTIVHDPRPINFSSTAEADAWGEAQSAVLCNQACEANVEYWLTFIKDSCTTITVADSLLLRDELMDFCLDNCCPPNPGGPLTEEAIAAGLLDDVIDILDNYTAFSQPCDRFLDSIAVPDPVVYQLDGFGDPVTEPCVKWDPCLVALMEFVKNNWVPNAYPGTFNLDDDVILKHCYGAGHTLTVNDGSASPDPNTIVIKDGSSNIVCKIQLLTNTGNPVDMARIKQLEFPRIQTTQCASCSTPSGYTYQNIEMDVTTENAVPPGDATETAWLYSTCSFSFTQTDCFVADSIKVDSSFYFDPGNLADSCKQLLIEQAIYDANITYQNAVQNYLNTHLQQFNRKCMESPFGEEFYYTHTPQEYHYTLYYYDQAGNLVQTVPPEGVDVLNASTTMLFMNGTATTANNPDHTLVTNFKYNSVGQKTEQTRPDDGTIRFWYNEKDQLRLSQDARQLAEVDAMANPTPHYSYIKYDELGRTVESGELNDFGTSAVTETQLSDLSFPDRFVYSVSDITTMRWDEDYTLSGAFDNLRLRLFMVTRECEEGNLTHRSVFSYDDHGNAKEHRNIIPGLGMKKTLYEYQLMSGRVKTAHYQPGEIDYFAHRYCYDEDNRLTHAFTSRDGLIWDRDARYIYYPHLPLARHEIGEDDVQAADFYYTIHNWGKGVNMPGDDQANYDPGRDGMDNASNLNRWIARDEMAYALAYYDTDYAPIGASVDLRSASNSFWNQFLPTHNSGKKGLFNGNISMMMTTLDPHQRNFLQTGIVGTTMGMSYRYDQLNRISSAESNRPVNYDWLLVNTGQYNTDYTYDANGNFETLNRWAPEMSTGGTVRHMDEFTFRYRYDGQGRKLNNRLVHINDDQGIAQQCSTGACGPWTYFDNDIDDHGPYFAMGQPISNPNYSHDETGRLLEDKNERIESIVWDDHDRVKEIERTTAGFETYQLPNLSFRYDGMGRRVTKQSEHFVFSGPNTIETQYYIRDARGNTQAIYRQWEENDTLYTSLEELPMYGVERLGIDKRSQIVEKKCLRFCFSQQDDNSGNGGAQRLMISEMMYDSPLQGASSESSFGEYLVLYNTSSNDIRLDNYKLHHTGTGKTVRLNNLGSIGGDQMLVLGNIETVDENVDTGFVVVPLPPGVADTNQTVEAPVVPIVPEPLAVSQQLLDDFELVTRLPDYAADGKTAAGIAHLNLRLDDRGGTVQLLWDDGGNPVRIVDQMQYGKTVNGIEAVNEHLSMEELADLSGRPEMKALRRDGYNKQLPTESGISGQLTAKTIVVGPPKPLTKPKPEPKFHDGNYSLIKGLKCYELSNHLGNITLVVQDLKYRHNPGTDNFYLAEVMRLADYFPFGMEMPGRVYIHDNYRYGFNGMEKDDDIKGGANSLDFGARMYDPRAGRWLSVDPMHNKHPDLSPYVAFGNNPITYVDPDGEDIWQSKRFKAIFGEELATALANSPTLAKMLSMYASGYSTGAQKAGFEQVKIPNMDFDGGCASKIDITFDVYEGGHSLEAYIPGAYKKFFTDKPGYTVIEIVNEGQETRTLEFGDAVSMGYVAGGAYNDLLNKNTKINIHVFVNPAHLESCGESMEVVGHEVLVHAVVFANYMQRLANGESMGKELAEGYINLVNGGYGALGAVTHHNDLYQGNNEAYEAFVKEMESKLTGVDKEKFLEAVQMDRDMQRLSDIMSRSYDSGKAPTEEEMEFLDYFGKKYKDQEEK